MMELVCIVSKEPFPWQGSNRSLLRSVQ
ncbi:unnamed protein product [Spirodela intermedia]|uniref:Uncharacterized protein n=2 Tax=Spirodela intermedia TaxID=51605 RepID=A0A7I8IF63_SPIIN|nr:unnamed protein product [Spirodela intermedia]CAA6656448.1 unnamed protein product [Spirodela intermedia]CAA7392025.1 unnamed protein product [Spirodela intermedia]